MQPSIHIDIARQRQAEIAEKTRYAHHHADLRNNRAVTDSNTARRRRRRHTAALVLAGLLALALAPHALAGAPITPAVLPVPASHYATTNTTAAHGLSLAFNDRHLPTTCLPYLHHSATTCRNHGVNERTPLLPLIATPGSSTRTTPSGEARVIVICAV
jgi:hypothetical protein